jgi:tripartite-type tricarboxylate transporter receptor subunit TctC
MTRGEHHSNDNASTRRTTLILHSASLRAFATLMAALGLATAHAQSAWPNRPITLIVPSAPGGTTDFTARMIAEPLSKALGQPVIVDNRAGGNGTIGTTAVKRAAPDGYTLLLQYSGYHVITPALVKSLDWNPVRDFAPVANVLSAPQLVVVRGGLPVKSLPELVAYAKANPGKLNYASSGSGSLQHVTGEMLKQQAGIDMIHVPYKGTGPALTDLLAGSVDLTFGTPPPFMQHIVAGKIQGLAVTGKQRLSSLPNAPAASEVGFPKLDASSWFAVFAPAGTPKPIIDRLTSEIEKAMKDPAFVKKAEEQGAYADYMNPEKLGAFTREELARWDAVIKSAKISVE